MNEYQEKALAAYFRLMEECRELFAPSERIPIHTDPAALRRFVEETGRPLGVVYDNLPFFQVVADLIDAPQPFSYARVIYANRRGNGTVVVPRLTGVDGTRRLGLLRLFRHSSRSWSLEFPRGFLEPELSPEENATKELWEELGVAPQRVLLRSLGFCRPDTGLSAGRAEVFLADLEGVRPPRPNVWHEGIAGALWVSPAELCERIRHGEIDCGITLSALQLYEINAADE